MSDEDRNRCRYVYPSRRRCSNTATNNDRCDMHQEADLVKVHLVHWRDAMGDPTTGTTLRFVRAACGTNTAWSDRRSVDPYYVTCGGCKRTRLHAQLEADQ